MQADRQRLFSGFSIVRSVETVCQPVNTKGWAYKLYIKVSSAVYNIAQNNRPLLDCPPLYFIEPACRHIDWCENVILHSNWLLQGDMLHVSNTIGINPGGWRSRSLVFWAGCRGVPEGRRGSWTGFGKHYSLFGTESTLENVFLYM